MSERQREIARLLILGLALMITAALIGYAIQFFCSAEALHNPAATHAIKL